MAQMSMMGLGLGAVGSMISANGTLASGDAAMAAAQYNASASRNAAELSATATENASELSATATENSAELTAKAQELSGQFTQANDEFVAAQYRQNATNTRAQAQRSAFDINDQTRLALSTFQARAAGSGLNATGETPMSVVGQIGARGTYLALSEMANGENTARGMEDQATAAHLTGLAAKYGADLAAAGTRYSGAATAQATRYSGAATAQATRYGGQTSATAALMQGSAAKSASQSSALGTLASGFGSTMTKAGSLMYPTTAKI